MLEGRLIIDSPASGAWNMSIDQALLESCEESGQITLRIYQWEVPTLSLGYFQQESARQGHPSSLECPIVRRRTGGGAIVHDREVTYSLCIPSQQRWSAENRQLYDTMHETIIRLLKMHSVTASLYDPDHNGTNTEDAAGHRFLCFERRAKGDLIVDGYKVGGSAQRRLKRSLLQHGSILLSQSDCAPELPGIEELSGQQLSVNLFQEEWTKIVSECLSIDFLSGNFSSSEIETAERVQAEIFANTAWTSRR